MAAHLRTPLTPLPMSDHHRLAHQRSCLPIPDPIGAIHPINPTALAVMQAVSRIVQAPVDRPFSLARRAAAPLETRFRLLGG